MRSDGEIEKDVAQLSAYRRDDPLSDILDKYSNLLQEYKRLKSDYEEERDAREKYKQVAKSQERNPFVLVLVDGDGYVFNENLFGEGGSGGGGAAQLLNDAIKASLRRKGLEHCRIMVRIYANVAGLSKAMNKAGGLVGAEKRSLAPFIANFNRSYGLSEFVDAGELKENADFKLRALLHLYAENAQCKHIYFAACHDVAYISDLTPHLDNSERFTLIDAPCIRFHEEFTKLGFKIEALPGVFRSNPLGEASIPGPYRLATVADTAAAQTPAPQVAVGAPKGPAHQTPACRYPPGKCKFGSSCRYLHPNDDARRDMLGPSNSWRDPPPPREQDANGTPIPMYNGFPLQKETLPEGYVAVNRFDYRLDPYIPLPSPSTIIALNARTKTRQVCNRFHLTGFCPNGSNCMYDHSPLEEKFKGALESLARSAPCTKLGACRDAACTKGHICQVPECRHRGGKAFCRLPTKCHTQELRVDRYVLSEKPAHVSLESSTNASPESSLAESTAEGTSLVPEMYDSDYA